MNICLFVPTEYINVTDSQTDGRTDRQTPRDGTGRALCICVAKIIDMNFGGNWIAAFPCPNAIIRSMHVPRRPAKFTPPPPVCMMERVDCVKNAIHASSDGAHHQREVDFMFPPSGPPRCNSACYTNSTCVVIKPHAIVDGMSD